MTQIKILLEPRFLRIPTRWEIRQTEEKSWYERYEFNQLFDRRKGEHRRKRKLISVAVPSFSHNRDGTLAIPHLGLKPVAVDGWQIRNHFLRMKQDEESALRFLEDVGLWTISEGGMPSTEGHQGILRGWLGTRYLDVWADPIPVSHVWRTQDFCRELLGNPAQLRTEFTSSRPWYFDKALPMHLEWHGKYPIAVLQAITFTEMMAATFQFDLARRARFRYCKRPDCNIPFPVITKHHKVYCSWPCAHLEAVRNSRKTQ